VSAKILRLNDYRVDKSVDSEIDLATAVDDGDEPAEFLPPIHGPACTQLKRMSVFAMLGALRKIHSSPGRFALDRWGSFIWPPQSAAPFFPVL
jgi:hypothetical protein